LEIAKVASIDLHSIFSGLFKLALLSGAAFFSGLVVISYRSDRAPVFPQFDLRDPARSAQRLAVWLGVRALVLGLRAANRMLAILAEASAEVGDWFLSLRDPETR
jgi:hypothetical protein